jgi:uncharacterized protein YcbX
VIQLHPIKGLDPVRVEQARVLATGALEFDRRWALTDSRGRFVNGKNYAGTHAIRATYDLTKLEVALDGRAFSLVRDTTLIAQWLSDHLGDTMQFQEDDEAGFPDDTDSPGPTFVSSGSITQVADWFSFSLDQTRRRFRTNIEFESTEPFWEDRLYGSSFQVGNVTVGAVNPCQRCIVPSRDALTGTQDPGFQKRFAELRRANMPVFAKTTQFNHHYRFAVNTRIDAAEAGKTICIGDSRLTID